MAIERSHAGEQQFRSASQPGFPGSDYVDPRPGQQQFPQAREAAMQAAAQPSTLYERTQMKDPQFQNPNPKDAAGRAKIPLSLWPATATAVGAIGLLEGKLKYGRNNWRVSPVYASVYVDALKRHMALYMEGQDLSSDCANIHLGNALACLAILVDAGAHNTLIDDRNFNASACGAETQQLFDRLTPMVAQLEEQFAGRIPPKHYTLQDAKGMLGTEAGFATAKSAMNQARRG